MYARFRRMAKAMPTPVADKKKVARDALVTRVSETLVFPGLLERLVASACDIYSSFLDAKEPIAVMMPVKSEMSDTQFSKLLALLLKTAREEDDTLLERLLTGLCRTDDGKYVVGCILATVGIVAQLEAATHNQDKATRAVVGLLREFGSILMQGKKLSDFGLKV